MTVSLSIKRVPDELASRLRARAARNRRSLQRELLTILEAAVAPESLPSSVGREAPRLSIEQVFERASALLPGGTPSSVELIRAMRDERSGIVAERPASVPRRRTR